MSKLDRGNDLTFKWLPAMRLRVSYLRQLPDVDAEGKACGQIGPKPQSGDNLPPKRVTSAMLTWQLPAADDGLQTGNAARPTRFAASSSPAIRSSAAGALNTAPACMVTQFSCQKQVSAANLLKYPAAHALLASAC